MKDPRIKTPAELAREAAQVKPRSKSGWPSPATYVSTKDAE